MRCTGRAIGPTGIVIPLLFATNLCLRAWLLRLGLFGHVALLVFTHYKREAGVRRKVQARYGNGG